jgi:hypothetical protein
MRVISKSEKWIGAFMILAIGLIHAVLAPGEFDETSYIGLMFGMCGVASVIAAIGIVRGEPLWGWGLGLLIAGGAFVGYILSRTVGLPGMEVEEWLNSLGILSLVLEISFVGLYLWTRPGKQRAVESRT